MATKKQPLSAVDLARLRRQYAIECQYPEAIRRDFAALGDEIDRLLAELREARATAPKAEQTINLLSWGLGALS